jgi:hypothetical protein
LIAVRVLEAAAAEALDVDGRQGAVEAMLTLQDGRKAAFEVTNLAADGALETASLLAKDNHKWSLPGKWFWSIEVGSPQDLRRLKQCYAKIILICEAAGVAQPDHHPLAWSPSADPDLQWLIENSSCNMFGHPEQLTSNMQNPGASVTPTSGGGFIDDSMSGWAHRLHRRYRRIPPPRRPRIQRQPTHIRARRKARRRRMQKLSQRRDSETNLSRPQCLETAARETPRTPVVTASAEMFAGGRQWQPAGTIHAHHRRSGRQETSTVSPSDRSRGNYSEIQVVVRRRTILNDASVGGVDDQHSRWCGRSAGRSWPCGRRWLGSIPAAAR